MLLIDYQEAIDRYHAEWDKQDICDGAEDRDWLKRCFDEAPTVDPVHAAGGCYCRECCFGRTPCSEDMRDGYVYCQQQSWYKQFDAFCSDGEPKETRK